MRYYDIFVDIETYDKSDNPSEAISSVVKELHDEFSGNIPSTINATHSDMGGCHITCTIGFPQYSADIKEAIGDAFKRLRDVNANVVKMSVSPHVFGRSGVKVCLYL